MLLQDIPARAVPIVNVRGDQASIVEGEFAPTANRDRRIPRQWRRPIQGPVCTDVVACASNLMQVHVAVAEPLLDEANHLAVAIAPPKLRHRIFEIHIGRVNIVGLIRRKPLVVSFKKVNNIHDKSQKRANQNNWKQQKWIFRPLDV